MEDGSDGSGAGKRRVSYLRRCTRLAIEANLSSTASSACNTHHPIPIPVIRFIFLHPPLALLGSQSKSNREDPGGKAVRARCLHLALMTTLQLLSLLPASLPPTSSILHSRKVAHHRLCRSTRNHVSLRSLRSLLLCRPVSRVAVLATQLPSLTLPSQISHHVRQA